MVAGVHPYRIAEWLRAKGHAFPGIPVFPQSHQIYRVLPEWLFSIPRIQCCALVACTALYLIATSRRIQKYERTNNVLYASARHTVEQPIQTNPINQAICILEMPIGVTVRLLHGPFEDESTLVVSVTRVGRDMQAIRPEHMVH